MVKILKKEKLAEKVTKLVFEAPLIAAKAQAGQFVILRVEENGERIPLTIADVNKETGAKFNGTGLNNISQAFAAGNYTITIENADTDNVTGYVASADFTVNKALSSVVIVPFVNVTYPATTAFNFTVVNVTEVNWTIVNKKKGL